MAFSSVIKTALSIVVLGLLLDACCRGTPLIADPGFQAGASTGSTTSVGGSTGGSSSSTGGAMTSSTTSSGTGTTGGSPADAGACVPGPASNLQSEQGYLPELGSGHGTTADLNGDGLLDVIVFSGIADGGNGFYVLLGLPDGGLGSPTYYPQQVQSLRTPFWQYAPVVAADLNGDGHPQVLYDLAGSGIQILSNDGGRLEMQAPPIETSSFVAALAAADLNQDGIADIVDGEVTTWEPTSNASDGSDYIVNIFLGDGDGGFSAAVPVASLSHPFPAIPDSATLFLSDLNQDGFPDIVAAAIGSSQVGVLLHEVDGGYQTTLYSFPETVTAVSLLRKGAAPDLIVAYDHTTPLGEDGSAVIQILTNAGDGTFAKGSVYALPNLAWELTVLDFNGDCIPDIAGGQWDYLQGGQGLSVLFGIADGGFGAPQSLPIDNGAPGSLTILGPTSSPRALVSLTAGDPSSYGVVVYGDASRP